MYAECCKFLVHFGCMGGEPDGRISDLKCDPENPESCSNLMNIELLFFPVWLSSLESSSRDFITFSSLTTDYI